MFDKSTTATLVMDDHCLLPWEPIVPEILVLFGLLAQFIVFGIVWARTKCDESSADDDICDDVFEKIGKNALNAVLAVPVQVVKNVGKKVTFIRQLPANFKQLTQFINGLQISNSRAKPTKKFKEIL